MLSSSDSLYLPIQKATVEVYELLKLNNINTIYHACSEQTIEENPALARSLPNLIAPDEKDNHKNCKYLKETDEYLEENGNESCAVIICDHKFFPQLMRKMEPYFRNGYIVIPADPDWVVPKHYRSMTRMQYAWETHPAVNYVARSGLKGHYLEFGIFWGKSFFNNYFLFHKWLEGKFYAFDSFAGLSKPLAQETHSTGGDFRAGEYYANEESFTVLGTLLGIPKKRTEIVKGFFDRTIRNMHSTFYGIEPESVSVAYIDCDLYDPTKDVLNFISQAMEPGGLIYFDDWRLCRASPKFGERGAALAWLDRNQNYELIELHRDSWQHQWFIFQKKY